MFCLKKLKTKSRCSKLGEINRSNWGNEKEEKKRSWKEETRTKRAEGMGKSRDRNDRETEKYKK